MPGYKYKTFEEAESALWNFQPDEVKWTHCPGQNTEQNK